jgi:Kef-type K+ transport system membrane component KefB
VAAFLLALALIALLAFVAGTLARRLKQPPVIGEVFIGILLGPTLFNAAISDALFPADIRPFLSAVANVGVALFMFTVGAEINAGLLRGRRIMAGTIAVGSIVLPFTLGAVLALHLFHAHRTDNRLAFVLFMGAAMSVTAFPVLARILTDRGMSRTWLGNLALACAAIDDVLAWFLLAAVTVVAAGFGSQWLVLLIVPYTLVMFVVVRPLLRRLMQHPSVADRNAPASLLITLVGLFGSAAFTEWIGLQFIFGAFLFGAIMPRAPREDPQPGIAGHVIDKISDLNGLLLLPVFFIVAGLKVDLSGMGTNGAVELALILVVAVGGKFVGAFLAARLGGLRNRPASALAVLINTRGLTELIILSVGLQIKVIDGALYSSMVVMALVTTAMAAPLLQWIYPMPPKAGPVTSARDGAEAQPA